ncbi:MAG: ADOP family duplicated permease [Gemmatimonadota bacterium]
MDRLKGILKQFRALVRKGVVEQELDEELRFHVEKETERLVREEGLERREARRRTLVAFGGMEQAKEGVRQARWTRWVEDVGKDVRFAARTLRKSPGFALAAVATLALGLGATTAMFTVVDAVLLRPLPVADEDRVLVVWERDFVSNFQHVPFTYADVREVRDRTGLLDDAAALTYVGASQWVLHRDDGATAVQGTAVTGNFFRVLGVESALGRLLRPEDDRRGAESVVVLGHGLWRRAFGGDTTVVGRTIRLNETTYTVVGVAPEGFGYPARAEAWAPLWAHYGGSAFGRELLERHAFLDIVARIRPGATREQAEAELAAIHEHLAVDDLNRRENAALVVRTLRDVVVGTMRPVLSILVAVVALVLVIAGVNVANLLLIRGIARRREFAIRGAIGAGRARIARQLLVESIVLAVAGGMVGVLVARWGADAVIALAPPELPRLDSVGIDARALGFSAAASLVAAVVFGLIPAFGATRRDLAASLRHGARAAGERRTRWPGREVLVIAQVGLTLTVLVGATLLLRSLDRLQSVELGFRHERLILADVVAPSSKFPDGESQFMLAERLARQAESLPGVVVAAPVYTRPFSGDGGIDGRLRAEGQTPEQVESNPFVNLEMVAANHFETLGQPVVRGRGFTEADREGTPPVAIVNETLARRVWPGEDPVGKRIRSAGDDWQTVVGVAADARYRALEEVRPSVYLPWRQWHPVGPGWLALRTRSDASGLLPLLRDVVGRVDPDVGILSAGPVGRLMAKPLARPRFSTALLAAFAGLGLVLSAVGVYGVMAAFVRLRTREMGIRMAIGARRRDVLRVVLRRGMVLAGLGAALGVAAALVAARALEALLFEVSPSDPVALGVAAAVVLGVAFAAAYLPARAATRVDPMQVLHAE